MMPASETSMTAVPARMLNQWIANVRRSPPMNVWTIAGSVAGFGGVGPGGAPAVGGGADGGGGGGAAPDDPSRAEAGNRQARRRQAAVAARRTATMRRLARAG